MLLSRVSAWMVKSITGFSFSFLFYLQYLFNRRYQRLRNMDAKGCRRAILQAVASGQDHDGTLRVQSRSCLEKTGESRCTGRFRK